MGVTIHYRLSQRKDAVKATLDRAQGVAEQIKVEQASKVGIPIEITRYDEQRLRIDIGGCESLTFYFQSVKEINKEAEKGWSYAHAVLTDDGKKELDAGYEIETYPQNEIVYCADFCKTQYGSSIVEHKWVADILRMVAAYCQTTEVSDEGDYYHTGKIENAAEAIEENGKMIDSLTGQLTGQWGAENVIKGGSTKIKATKRKK